MNIRKAFGTAFLLGAIAFAGITIAVTLDSDESNGGGGAPDPQEPAFYPTIVCGFLATPSRVMGVPMSIEITYANTAMVTFQDRYVLTSLNAPSLFLGKLSVFVLEGSSITQYALAAEEYHPCPD